MEKKDAKYNFNKNLIKASYCKEIENAKKEWKIIYEENRDNPDGQCICQRKVKNVIYMYNIKSKNTIIVGSVCCKKFNMENDKLNNSILSTLFSDNLTKGEYINIDNIVVYCKSIEEQLRELIQNKYESFVKQYENNNWYDVLCNDHKYIINDNDYVPLYLLNLADDINELIQKYDLKYLTDVYLLIQKKINEIIKEGKQYDEEKVYKIVKYYINHKTNEVESNRKNCKSLDHCYQYISNQSPIGILICSKHMKSLYTILRFEIIHNNQLIRTITTNTFQF